MTISAAIGDWSLGAWFGLVLVIGILDDLYDVSYLIRLGSHAAIVTGLFVGEGLGVNSIGAIFGTTDVDFFGFIAIIFTCIGVIGAVNAVNMIDGLDGLLGSLCLSSIILLALLSALNESTGTQVFDPTTIAAIAGALTGFLLLNGRIFGNKTAHVFLGDAGSTLLGFLLVYLLIDHSQGPGATFSPVLAGWILGLPLLDGSAVIASRLIDGKSPFKPDRSHLHHILQDVGFSVNRTVVIMLGLHITLMLTGTVISFAATERGDFILFWGFVVLVLLRVGLTSSRWSLINRLSPKDHSPQSNPLPKRRDVLER